MGACDVNRGAALAAQMRAPIDQCSILSFRQYQHYFTGGVVTSVIAFENRREAAAHWERIQGLPRVVRDQTPIIRDASPDDAGDAWAFVSLAEKRERDHQTAEAAAQRLAA